MPFTFFDNDASSSTATAVQSAILGSNTAVVQDIPGCSLTLVPGMWLVVANFASARFWLSSAGYNGGYYYFAIRRADNVTLEARYGDIYWTTPSPARVEVGDTLTALIAVPSTTTYKMSGYTAVAYGTNFASGFRSDSGTGLSCEFSAVKVGP